jgi:uncharacterized membrane protein YvbJ
VKQTTTHETSTDETMSVCNASGHTNEEEVVSAGGELARAQPAPTRYVQRAEVRQEQIQRRKYLYGILFRAALFIIIGCAIVAGVLKGFGAIKTYDGREITIERFEEALEDQDVSALKKYIRISDTSIPVSTNTLKPLFTYLDEHPEGYKKIHSELEKQSKKDSVYIKGLTSKPPIFLMRVYEKQYFLFNQYVFEPALYSLVANVEGEGVSIFVNDKKVYETKTETFSGKIGSYLPGIYEITAVKKAENETKKQTKKVVLFGGQRVQHVHFQFK